MATMNTLRAITKRKVNNFPLYLMNGKIFQKKIEYKMCVFGFSTILSEKLLILKDFSIILSSLYIVIHTKYPLFLSDFNEN
jgi:hypothetical protein